MAYKNMIKLEPEAILTPVIALTVSSSDELKAMLYSLKSEKRLKSRYVAVALREDKVLSRIFNFQRCSAEEIKNNIISEAVDLLSLPSEEIEIDYQIFHSDKEKIQGVFICAPKELIKKYLDVLDNIRLISLKLTDALLIGIDAFLLKNNRLKEEVCLLDLTHQNRVYCSVIQGKQCKFLREIKYEASHEAKRAVIQTLQGIGATSAIKKIDQIHVVGDFLDKNMLIAEISKISSATIHTDIFNPNISLTSWKTFFSLNLLRNHVLSLRGRNMVIVGTYLLIFSLLLKSIFLSIDIRSKEITLNILKSSYDLSEYAYAKGLQEELK